MYQTLDNMPRLSEQSKRFLADKPLELISIIVPIYNVANYLGQCVESILAQTYSNLEILLINDGSTDNSGELCDELAKKDSRIRVIHKENSGVSDSRNLGIENAKGKYLSFVDSDDFLADTFIEKLYVEMLKQNVSIVVTDYNKYNEENSTFYFHTTERYVRLITPKEYFDEIFKTNTLAFVVPWCKLIATELFHGEHPIRFPSGMMVGEDKMITYLLAQKAKNIVYLHEANYTYRLRPGSATASGVSLKRAEDDLLGCEQRMLDLALIGYDLKPAIDWYHYILKIHEQQLKASGNEKTEIYQKIRKKLALLANEY